MPINLLVRVRPSDLDVLNRPSFYRVFFCFLVRKCTLDELVLRKSFAPDFIEGRGHTFGADLSDADKGIDRDVKTL